MFLGVYLQAQNKASLTRSDVVLDKNGMESNVIDFEYVLASCQKFVFDMGI